MRHYVLFLEHYRTVKSKERVLPENPGLQMQNEVIDRAIDLWSAVFSYSAVRFRRATSGDLSIRDIHGPRAANKVERAIEEFRHVHAFWLVAKGVLRGNLKRSGRTELCVQT